MIAVGLWGMNGRAVPMMTKQSRSGPLGSIGEELQPADK